MLASVLDPLYQVMAAILAAIYSVIPNYAVAIFGLTCIVLAILTPLTLKGLRSTIKIQKLMPEQKRLQAQFKDDRQALNEAIMAMYKENKVSPVGGCLPFLVQSPFFIALFGVLQGMTRVKYWLPNGQPFDEAATVGKDVPGAVAVGLPKHLPTDSSFYKSLYGTVDPVPGSGLPSDLQNAPGEVKAFGFDLARSAAEMASKGFVKFLPYLLLIVLMVGLQVFAQRQVNRRNPAAAAANPQMQTITKVMPFMFGIFGWGFQAGLTLYWTTSSALRIVQQWALYRFDPTLAESVKEKREALERDAASGKKTDKAKGAAPAPRGLARFARARQELAAPPKGGGGSKASAGGGKAKAQKPTKPAGKPADKPAGGAKSAKQAPANATKADAKPASKPAKPAANGASRPNQGTSNGNGAGAPRANPGRQQPKKRRKGR